MHGAGTSPNLDAFAYASAQVKKAIEVTHVRDAVTFVRDIPGRVLPQSDKPRDDAATASTPGQASRFTTED